MLFSRYGKASFVLGGQFGSEGKGAAVAYLATTPHMRYSASFDIVTCNNGAQSGHTSIHNGVKKVAFHLPTYSLYRTCFTYLNAGSIIDPELLLKELDENPQVLRNGFAIHPNAAIITEGCKEAENQVYSAQTAIASTRKGVGEALARKALRWGMTAKDYSWPWTGSWFLQRIDLNQEMGTGKSVLVEIPQGHSLSLDSQFYPHTTSRNCTVAQAMSDAGIHPDFYGQSMLVVRTYPIRVGNIEAPITVIRPILGGSPGEMCQTSEIHHYSSGDCFPDQREISWADLGVEPEITTVTKRVRRVFTFSDQQVIEAIRQTRPDVILLSFCDYYEMGPQAVNAHVKHLRELSDLYGRPGVKILTSWGPTTDDVIEEDQT